MAARVRQARWGDAQPNLRELTIEFQEVEKICLRISSEKRASGLPIQQLEFQFLRTAKLLQT
jgi:hypothetical protein